MSVRLGPNIHNKIDNGQEYSANDKEQLAKLLTDLRPSAIVVMNNKDWAMAYKMMLPDTNVIFRLYHKEEGRLWDLQDADTFWHNMQGYCDPRITLYITNESNGKCEAEDIPVMRKAVTWWTRLMELAAKQNIRLCLPNWSSGSPDLKWITDDALWPIIKPLYDAFQKYPMHYYGAHEYFWHSVEDSKHHVGRHADVMAALQKRGDYKLQWVLTEIGSDDIWSRQKRGYKNTLTEEQYADATVKAKNTVWNVPYIVGITWYCHGAVTSEWTPFNTARAEIFNRIMVQANNTPVEIPTPPPPPTPPFVIVPADKGTGEPFTIQLGSTLQAKASADVTCKVGSLIPGERVTVYRKPREVADGFTWHYFERFSTPVGESPNGWTSHTLPPPIDVTPPPPPSTAEGDIRLVAAKYSMIETLEAEIQVLQGEIKIILSKWYTSMAA